MAERQYIGARYVPIFGGDWNPNESYDALVIVKYQNKTYTSKIPVPPGIQITNETYWVLSGNVDANITDIQNRLSIVETISNANKTLLKGRKFVFMGDSYDVINENGWSNIVKKNLGLTNDQFYKISAGGIGFTRSENRTFQYYLSQNYQRIVPDPENVTDIIVCGGANDISSNIPTIQAAIKEFKNYCLSIFPNAILRIGFIGWKNDPATFSIFRMARNAYLQACTLYGIPYLGNVESIMHNTEYLQEDNLHPNTDGINILGGGIAQALVNGYCTIRYNTTASFTPSNIISGSTDFLNIIIFKDTITFQFLPTELTALQELQAGKSYIIGTYSNILFKGTLFTYLFYLQGPSGYLILNTNGNVTFYPYKTIPANTKFGWQLNQMPVQDIMM